MAKIIHFSKAEYDKYRAKGLSNTQIASKLGMSDASLYAKLKQLRENTTSSTDEYSVLYEHRVEVNSLLKAGVSRDTVASRYGVSVDAVDMFVAKRKKFTPEQMHDMRLRLRNGESEQSIADDYDTTAQIISAIFKTNICSNAQDISTDTMDQEHDPAYKSPIQMLVSIADTLLHADEMLRGLQEYNDECSARLDTVGKKIQDILHRIEFDDYDADAQTILTSLAEYRKERRELKDFIELSAPLLGILRRTDGLLSARTVIHDLAMAGNDIRVRAKDISNRVYKLKGGDE